MSGRPIPYRDLIALAEHARAFDIPVPKVAGQTIEVQPNHMSGKWAVLRDHLFGHEYLGETGWASTDKATVAEVYRWSLSQALQQADTAAQAQGAEHASWQAKHDADAKRARDLAQVADELLEPIREAMTAAGAVA
jgi:hypothetical protein